MKLYIAGPMRGIPEFNFPAFFAAEETLRGWGYEIINPARRDVDNGFKYQGLTGDEDLTALGFNLRSALGWDLAQIAGECDGVVTLDGWHRSRGAKAEVSTAVALDLPVNSVDGWILRARVDRDKANANLLQSLGSTRDGDEVLGLTILDGAKLATATLAPNVASNIVSMQTGEVRVTSATGGAKGSKPARFDMIPTDALWELAEQYGKGAEKYAPVNGLDNWRNGYDWSLSFAAAFRHLTAAMGGEDIDAETGSKHVIAAAWHMFALAHFMNNDRLREQFDNRQGVRERIRDEREENAA